MREDELRANVAKVREKLDAAISAIDRAEQAREQASARGAKSEGAYRDVAAEHAAAGSASSGSSTSRATRR